MSIVGGTNGHLVGVVPNPAVPEDLLLEISQMLHLGVSMDDVIDRLHPRTVPPGYAFTNWIAGKGYEVCLY